MNLNRAGLCNLDQQHVDGEVAEVGHQGRRCAGYHEGRKGDPEEYRQGGPEIGNVLCHDEQANNAEHDVTHGHECGYHGHSAVYREPRKGELDQ